MPYSSFGTESSTSVDVILQWLADILDSDARLEEWCCLPPVQRSAWLEAEGFCPSELHRSFSALSATGDVDASLLAAIECFLLQGDAIADALRPALSSLLLDRWRQLEALAGGSKSGPGVLAKVFVGSRLQADFRSARGAIARSNKLIQEAGQTHLGRFIDDVGGIEDKAATHLTNQIVTEIDTEARAVGAKAAPLIGVLDSAQKTYDTTKQHFISQKEDIAVTAESNEIARFQSLHDNGGHPVQAERASGATRPVLTSRERAVVDDDKAYFKEHDLSTLQSGLETKPTYIVSGTGSSRSVSLSYDWDGTRGSVVLDRANAAGVLDPALGAVNRLSARALWSARQSAAIASWEGQQWPQWQAHLAQAHPKLSNQLAQALHTTFPKAELPASFSQLVQQGRAGGEALLGEVKTRERRAERHGVSLMSLQRHRDAKRLRQKPLFQEFSGPVQRLLHAEPDLRSAVRSQLQAMALAVLVADVDKQLAGNGQALALRNRAEAFTSSHSTLLQSLKADLAQSTTTLSFSDRHLDISWTVGEGVAFSRSARDPMAAYAPDPTLTLTAHSTTDPQNSLWLSAGYAPGGQLSTSFFSSRDNGTVVRQFGNAFTLSSTWQRRLKGFQAFGGRELLAYRQSFQSAARRDVSAELHQHVGLQSHARLDAFGQRALKNSRTIHRIHHDVRVDRRIEARIKPHYGSLRAQKLLMNQLQHDRASYIQAAATVRRIQNAKSLLRQDLPRTLLELDQGWIADQGFKGGLKEVYTTMPDYIVKNSSGLGYHLVRSGARKDYWQTLTQKQRYAIFNPIYHSEAIFYKSERSAFLAGAGEYTALRRDGATKKMARLGASATYFNVLLQEDKVLLKTGFDTSKLAYAPMIVRRQKHLVKRVVRLNRHSFAWRLRLSWKVKRERFFHKHVAAYEHYMLNNKFTGFHPFHRIARKSMSLVKTAWHFVLHPIVHFMDRNVMTVVSLFGDTVSNWVASTAVKIFNGTKFIAYHALKAVWHLPEHLYHHTLYFGKQLLFAITHPWAYRKIWTGIKKDFKGIYKLAKTIGELLIWIASSQLRAFYEVGRFITGQGANWGSILHGAFHKKLWHKAKLISDAWRFAGLASLVGKTAATRDAIKVEMLRMQLRRDLHHDGFLASPWRHFVHQHKSFVSSQLNDLNSGRIAALMSVYRRKRAALQSDEKALVMDFGRYELSATYRLAVQARVASDKARLASYTARLKPSVRASFHTLTHDILKEMSKVNHKSQRIKMWTLRELSHDIRQILSAYQVYRHLAKRGRKEVLVGIVAFKDLNRTHKSGVIKTTLQAFNANVLGWERQWKTYFKSGTSNQSSYAYAVSQDWMSMGQYMGGKLLMVLQGSFQSASVSKQVGKEVRSAKLGSHVFDDIMGGFWLHHYDRLFVAKDASLIAVMQADRRNVAVKIHGIEMVLAQPRVHKIFAYWLTRNANSVIAKDVRAAKFFGRALATRIHKWERIERLGNAEVTAGDLTGLQSLHKNQMMGASLAGVVARTARWQDLSLQQQAQDRASYNAWISYNQTTNHALTKSYNKFKKNNSSEYQAWQAEQEQIAGGGSLTVGALLLSVKANDTKHSKWVTLPKPALVNFNQHLQAAAANLASRAQNPQMLAVSVVLHVSSHSDSAHVETDPSLFAYLQQVKHFSHKIKKKLADSKAKKEKAEKAAKEVQAKKEAAEKKVADAKQEIDADEVTAKRQVETAKTQVEDGSMDQQQIISEAEQVDATSVQNIQSDKAVDQLGKMVEKNDADAPKEFLQQVEGGDLKASMQELDKAKLDEQRRLEEQLRHAADQDRKVEALEDGVRVDRQIQQGDFKQDLAHKANQFVEDQEQVLTNDLRQEASSVASDGEAELVQTFSSSSELVDEFVTDIKTDTQIAEEDLVKTEAEAETVIEDAAAL